MTAQQPETAADPWDDFIAAVREQDAIKGVKARERILSEARSAGAARYEAACHCGKPWADHDLHYPVWRAAPPLAAREPGDGGLDKWKPLATRYGSVLRGIAEDRTVTTLENARAVARAALAATPSRPAEGSAE